MKTKHGKYGILQKDPIEERLPSIGKVRITSGPQQLIGLTGEVIGIRNLTSLCNANEPNYSGLDRNCLVVRLLPDEEYKGYSYIRHLMEGMVEYIDEE